MSRLGKRKSVVDELSTDQEDLSTFKRVTVTMRKQDIKDMEDYINTHKEEEFDKSKLIRKALRFYYKQN